MQYVLLFAFFVGFMPSFSVACPSHHEESSDHEETSDHEESSGHDHHDDKHHHDEVTSTGAHVHGALDLTVVLEGDSLQIRLDSPAMNILGFEHQASSKAEQAAVQQAKQALSTPSKLFSFDHAKCEAKALDVDMGMEERASDGHSDVEVEYQFHCKGAANIKSIAVSLFDVFPGIKTIQAQWVTQEGQGATTLTQYQDRIQLK